MYVFTLVYTTGGTFTLGGGTYISGYGFTTGGLYTFDGSSTFIFGTSMCVFTFDDYTTGGTLTLDGFTTDTFDGSSTFTYTFDDIDLGEGRFTSAYWGTITFTSEELEGKGLLRRAALRQRRGMPKDGVAVEAHLRNTFGYGGRVAGGVLGHG